MLNSSTIISFNIISFTQSSSSSGNRLFANPGDILEAKYRDFTLPRPYSISDDLEITSSVKYASNIPPIERVSIANNFIADRSGNVIIDLIAILPQPKTMKL